MFRENEMADHKTDLKPLMMAANLGLLPRNRKTLYFRTEHDMVASEKENLLRPIKKILKQVDN